MASQIEFHILIINPNSTVAMTESLSPIISNVNLTSNCIFSYFTAPSGPPSINNNQDAAQSLTHCIAAIDNEALLRKYHGFLVACYSQHPLVPWLRSHAIIEETGAIVTGIFEASVYQSLRVISNSSAALQPERARPHYGWGIVSTGKVWEELLCKAVREIPKTEQSGGLDTADNAADVDPQSTFVGVETTGLNATELHQVSHDALKQKMMDATKRLLRHGIHIGREVRAICLGCAGMAGLEQMVRDACIEKLGSFENADKVQVVDGVYAGAEWLSKEVARRNHLGKEEPSRPF